MLILHAARSETSSNSWKLSVISDASFAAWIVDGGVPDARRVVVAAGQAPLHPG